MVIPEISLPNNKPPVWLRNQPRKQPMKSHRAAAASSVAPTFKLAHMAITVNGTPLDASALSNVQKLAVLVSLLAECSDITDLLATSTSEDVKGRAEQARYYMRRAITKLAQAAVIENSLEP